MTHELIDKVIHSKRKSISIEINRQGEVLLRLPLNVEKNYLKNVIESRRDWIIQKKKEMLRKDKESPKHTFSENEKFWLLGAKYSLKHLKPQKGVFEFHDNCFFIDPDFLPDAKNIFEEWYKLQAREYIPPRVYHFAKKFNLPYKSINITSARKRWASRSSRGSLNFSWRMMLLPQDSIDYIICHELAHIRYMDHSQKFWGLCEQYYPGSLMQRQWLKKNSHLFDF